MRRALLVLSLAAATSAAAGTPVTLKASPTDADGRVTLSDLFEGANSDVVLAAGPKAGASVVLDAARVQLAAREAGLSWANPAGIRRIVVRAAGPGASAPDSAASRAAPAASSGVVEALTYARSLNAGAVVTAEDLTWAPLPRTPGDAVDDAEAAIGLALKKPVRAGTAVSSRDLGAPRVIAKNDAVSVHYRAGRVNLTLQGRAVTAAAVGEPVRILNTQSKSVIEAVAAGPGLAVVGPQADALKLRGAAALASR